MKILYGVQTTGNGHLVRSAAMIRYLRELGHEVTALLSGDREKTIHNPQDYEPYQRKTGLTFYTSRGKLKYLKTLKSLRLLRFYRDISSFPARDLDLVVTDYEPITARIARRNRIPSIGIGHLYAFAQKVPIPKGDPLGVGVMKYFAPADIPLGLHWHHFGQTVLPPTVPEDIYDSDAPRQDKILAYFPFEEEEHIHQLLRPLGDFSFVAYSPRIGEPHSRDNVQWRPVSRNAFVRDLSDCAGVLCNAGFSLISEALHLGRKVLAKPVAGQVEQKANALALQRLGLGGVMKRLDPARVRSWLQEPSPRPQGYPAVLPEVANWIHSGPWDRPRELAERLWSRVSA